jgi:diguanylate cyclase (GGDEF)-like protein
MRVWVERHAGILGSDRALAGLARIRDLLRVAAAAIGGSTGVAGPHHLQSGADFILTGAALDLEYRAQTSRAPLVIADTATHAALAHDQPRFADGSPIRFLAILPFGSDDSQPAHVLVLADRSARTIATANRLAMIAIESFRLRTAALAAAPRTEEAALVDHATAKAGIGVWQCQLPDNRLIWSAGVYDLFGLPRGSVVRRDRTVEQYDYVSRLAMEEARARAIEGGQEFMLDAEIMRADGEQRWMRLTGNAQSVNGVVVSLFGTKQDITAERLLFDRMRYLAETDAMTGLANRARIQDRLDHPAGISALLLVDLDGFKAVNDTFGHAIGDKCLRETANRLRSCCADAPLVGRLGGDEFAVILETEHSAQTAEDLARRIVACMQLPFQFGSARFELGASVGLAFHTDGPGETLFRQADQALYVAKADGRSTSRTYSQASDCRPAHSARSASSALFRSAV